MRGRHKVHQRSLLDCHLRLSDHLMSDHGDRMLMAHSVEGRYPFLDREVVKLAQRIPPSLKLNGFQEKYIVKEIANGLVPKQILKREKFGFFSSSSPALLRAGVEWVHDLLSYDYIKRMGYFSADAVEALKKRYCDPAVVLDPRSEDDFLMIVLSFNLLLSNFFDNRSYAVASGARTASVVA
jgi:asparagine synthase (glutamine-hydrolysing)